MRKSLSQRNNFKKKEDSFLVRQSFQGYYCSSGIVSLHGGSLEITLTDPLITTKNILIHNMTGNCSVFTNKCEKSKFLLLLLEVKNMFVLLHR